eukprot:COSAG01_NODE_16942_length_1191_cov_86.613553_2_plen_217_part_01
MRSRPCTPAPPGARHRSAPHKDTATRAPSVNGCTPVVCVAFADVRRTPRGRAAYPAAKRGALFRGDADNLGAALPSWTQSHCEPRASAHKGVGQQHWPLGLSRRYAHIALHMAPHAPQPRAGQRKPPNNGQRRAVRLRFREAATATATATATAANVTAANAMAGAAAMRSPARRVATQLRLHLRHSVLFLHLLRIRLLVGLLGGLGSAHPIISLRRL